MLVSIHLVARLLKIPVLRLDGHVLVVEEDTVRPGDPSARRTEALSTGRLLALAEAELAAVDGRRPRAR